MTAEQGSTRLKEYLTDHLSGAEAALELLDRIIDAQPFEAVWLTRLRAEIHSDKVVLAQLVQSFGAEAGALKAASAWLAEKLTRPKLDLDDQPPLGLFLSLEVLALGVTGKRSLWAALWRASPRDSRLQNVDFEALMARALDQHQQLERRRLDLAESALMGEPSTNAAR